MPGGDHKEVRYSPPAAFSGAVFFLQPASGFGMPSRGKLKHVTGNKEEKTPPFPTGRDVRGRPPGGIRAIALCLAHRLR